MTPRIIIGEKFERKVRIQIQSLEKEHLIGNAKCKGSKNITIWDDSKLIDIRELHKRILATTKEYVKEIDKDEEVIK